MSRAKAKSLRIAITTGDVDGVGSEVTSKALAKLKAQSGVTYYVWRSPLMPTRQLNLIDRHFKRITVSSWPEALKVAVKNKRVLIDINSNLPPPVWVETAAQASLFSHLDGMVTAPLSKTSIVTAGFRDMGHTGILKRVTGLENLVMGFVGDKFNVVLATDHIPVENIGANLTTPRLITAIKAANQLRMLLDRKSQSRPIAVLGLNPHAGEAGLIGSQEQRIHAPALQAAEELKIPVEGPLVPDAAFFRENWARYSVFVANYHDQGLIPFKMIHGQESGIQITLGLPFVRTSVDHGTAKDIFGKNVADSRSMAMALTWAAKLCLRPEKL